MPNDRRRRHEDHQQQQHGRRQSGHGDRQGGSSWSNNGQNSWNEDGNQRHSGNRSSNGNRNRSQDRYQPYERRSNEHQQQRQFQQQRDQSFGRPGQFNERRSNDYQRQQDQSFGAYEDTRQHYGNQGDRFPRQPMDAPMLPFLPPPPVAPVFGTGRRSFNDHSYHSNGTQASESFQSSSSTHDTTLKEPLSPGEIVMDDDEMLDMNSREDDGLTEEQRAVQDALVEAMNLRRGQAPEYILRMRDMGPYGYPPALIDVHVRLSSTLPFFGGSLADVLPKREIRREKLPAFRGYTNVTGAHVCQEFADLMSEVSEIDHSKSHKDALDRSGIEEFTCSSTNSTLDEVSTRKRKSEVIRYEIPEYEVSTSSDYQFAIETKSMKHSLESFAAGIQPFQNSHINKPTNFLKTLKNILKKKPEDGEILNDK